MWKRLIKRTLLVAVSLLGALGALGWWAHRQTKKVPDFYEQAISMPPPEQLSRSSEQLEANVRQLQDNAEKLGQWDAEFSVDQINAWLIDQLPKRFPTLHKKGLQDPRVMIDDGVVIAAARLKDKRIDAVLSCELSVQLTDQPNRLAIAVRSLRAGALPLPVSQFKDRIKLIASKANLPLTWETRDGETVALVDLPSEAANQSQQTVILESIELAEQRLVVAGKTGELEAIDYSPRGPIYRLALLDDESDAEVVMPIGDTTP